ncbi:F0F1 ATP synthase subunit delta [Nocardioides sp.]|uniref:F0F1 ATP synthase subunit delta n=1 Tax=Nocardioides sp. TaxID=35761 RepID=UPI003D1031AD
MSFRGPSAGSAAALKEQLTDSTSGEDLFAVATVLRSEPGLRRVATDVSIAAEAKAGLMQQVFGDKIGADAVSLVAQAVGSRWSSTRDLADALELLGVIAVAKSAGSDAGRLSDELFGFGQIVRDNPELRDALSDPARSIADKRGLVKVLLDGKALPATVSLVDQALAGSYRTVGVALAEYEQVAAEVYGQGVATVRVARPLADSEKTRLVAALQRQYGRDVHLNEIIDPDVIGGIRVEIGDDVIDGTVVSRLDDARRRLAG